MSALTRPPFPSVIDSSMIATFRSCPRKFELEYLYHFKPRTESVHLHAGKAFARGLEVARQAFYEEGADPETAIAQGVGALLLAYGNFECPEDSAKSATRMAGALEYYFFAWPLQDEQMPPATLPGSGKRAIEFSFLEPLESDHPESGDPLMYSGRFDQIVDYAGGLYGEDDKTTSQLGASWPKQWDLRSQFTGYTWGARRGGMPLSGFVVRGVSILKSKYDSAMAITYRPDWMVERWYLQVLRDIERMKTMWASGLFDYNLDHACAEYGGCGFRKVCMSQEPGPWLKQDFEQRRWDPVTREETLL